MDSPQNQVKAQPRWGLKGKLILSMLLVGVVPLLIGLVMAFLQGIREIEQVSGASFAGLAGETARKLDLVLAEEIAKTAHIATDLAVVDAVEQRRDRPFSDEQIREATKAWEAKDPRLIQTVTQGKLAETLRRYYAGTDSDPGHPIPLVTRSATRALFLTDRTGVLVASINADVAYVHARTAWWNGAFNKGVGAPYMENVAFDDRAGTYTFTISLPVMDRIRYEAIGIVHRVYDAKEFFAPSVYPIRFGRTGHVMLIDGHGTVISCPILPTGARIADEAVVALVTAPHPGSVKAPSDGHGGQGASIIGFAPLPETSRTTEASTGRKWHTFVWQSSGELFAPVRHLLAWMTVFGLIAVGLLGSLGYVAASRIVTPIRRLQEAAKLIGRGELREPITIKTGDEIEDLAAEINRMHVQLEAAFAGLTDQVELKAQEVRYLQKATDQILDSTPAPIILLDAQGQVHYLNQAAKRALTLQAADFNAGSLLELIRVDEGSRHRLLAELRALGARFGDGDPDSSEPATVSSLRDPLAPQLAAANVSRRELQIGASTYRYEWFRVTGRPGEGERIGLVLRDTTEESRLQDKLIQAEKTSSLGVLSAGIGHELNNPLFGILGLGEAIQDETDLGQAKQHARDIIQHGKRMASIIKDFTGLAQTDAKDRLVPVNLNDQLDQAIKLIQQAPDGATIEVRTAYHPLPTLRALPDEVRQIFQNVLTNAIQAMKGRGTLTVDTEAGDGTITVRIGDSGPGIPKLYLSKVFDPFFTTKQQGEGAGLGLTIARRLAMKYGGRVHIESEEGRGTVCAISFPLASSPTGKEGAT
jgi:signal transduction histidine kinase